MRRTASRCRRHFWRTLARCSPLGLYGRLPVRKARTRMFGIRTKEDVEGASGAVFASLHELYKTERQRVPVTLCARVFEGGAPCSPCRTARIPCRSKEAAHICESAQRLPVGHSALEGATCKDGRHAVPLHGGGNRDRRAYGGTGFGAERPAACGARIARRTAAGKNRRFRSECPRSTCARTSRKACAARRVPRCAADSGKRGGARPGHPAA